MLDLGKFCSRGGWEPQYSTPWVAGGYHISGSGTIFVYHATDEPDNDGGIHRIDPIPLITATNQALQSAELDTLGKVEPGPCSICGGREVVDVCVNCDGDGGIVCDACGSVLDCECQYSDHATEPTKCECVEGLQFEADCGEDLEYPIGNYCIALRHAYLMSTLGKVECTVIPNPCEQVYVPTLCVFQSGDVRGFSALLEEE